MLNNEETIVIINKSECSYNEAISVVIKYIYDLKNIELDINNINEPIREHDLLLLNVMFNVSKNYYQADGK